MTRTRILIVDDHAVVRAGLRGLIEAREDLVVVGEASCGKEALAELRRTPVDVVLADITMPDTVATTFIERVLTLSPSTKVLVLTMHDDPLYLRSVMAAGATGYVTKSAAPAELLEGIRAVHQGRTFVAAAMASPARPARPVAAARVSPSSPLSTRERQVLALLARGHTYDQVARALRVSVNSVGTYRSRIAVKLGAGGRADLVRAANDLGLLDPI